jgi:hypothetical protein
MNKIINMLIICFTLIIIYYLYSVYFTIYEYHNVGNKQTGNETLKFKNQINNIDLNLNKNKDKFFKLEEELLITNNMIKLNSKNIKNNQDQFKKIITNNSDQLKNDPLVNDKQMNNKMNNTDFNGLVNSL